VTVGALGPPGKRTFYLQARQEDQLVSLKLEKEQVIFLAGGLSEVLADLASPTGLPTGSDLELEEPVLAEWAVGSMQLTYDATADRVVLLAMELADQGQMQGNEEEGPTTEVGEQGKGPAYEEGLAGIIGTGAVYGPEGLGRGPSDRNSAIARVALTREQAAGVIENGRALLRSGRPPCPLCGYPLGEDHSCPKTNGHGPPAL
jgi:hypothetical protein